MVIGVPAPTSSSDPKDSLIDLNEEATGGGDVLNSKFAALRNDFILL